MAGRSALFLPDTDPKAGAGHMIRCLSLAEAMAAADWSCHLAVQTGAKGWLPRLQDWPGRPHVVAASDNPTALSGLGRYDVVVVDNYRVDAEYERACRSHGRYVVAIDDLANRPHDCDLLLDQTWGRQASDYAGFVRQGCHFLLGNAFTLISQEFPRLQAETMTRRRTSDRIHRILVSAGAVDSHDLTSRFLDALGTLRTTDRIDVVLGPGAPHRERIHEKVRAMGNGAYLHLGTDRMADMMSAADLALGAAGVSSWERCCLGLPALVLIAADNQRLVARTLAEHGAAEVLGAEHEVSRERLASAIRELLGSPSRLLAMAEAGISLCDGQGSSRVTVTIGELLRLFDAASGIPEVA
jgi:UDP-2,4-diacetamido-2,4,6-trideoxy-beta-L-altropyranose hydrolase